MKMQSCVEKENKDAEVMELISDGVHVLDKEVGSPAQQGPWVGISYWEKSGIQT